MLEKGVERVTIDEICKIAGIAKGGFYRYFHGKTELVEAIIEPMVEGVRAALNAGEPKIAAARDFAALEAVYSELAMTIAPLLLTEHRALRLYLAESRAPRVGARAPLRAWADEVSAIAERLAAAALDNPSTRPLPAAVTGRVIVGAVERLAFDLIDDALTVDPVVAAQTLMTLVLDGLRVR